MSRAGKTKIKRRIFTSLWLSLEGFGSTQLVGHAGCRRHGQGGTGGDMGTSNPPSQPARRGNVPPQQGLGRCQQPFPFDPGGKWKEQSWNTSSSSLAAKGRGILEQRCLQDSWGVEESLCRAINTGKVTSAEGKTPAAGSEETWSSVPPTGDALHVLAHPCPHCSLHPGSFQPGICTAQDSPQDKSGREAA